MNFLLLEISSDKPIWENWHEWLKINAEVATNIKRQNAERGSERGSEEDMRSGGGEERRRG